MKTMRKSVILALLLSTGCMTIPTGPPGEVASEILEHLDADRPAEARTLFERAAADDGKAERIYPILFESAKVRFESGDWAGSRRVLELMSEGYPNASAVREALVYDLYLERASTDTADEELLSALDKALAELEAGAASMPVWAELARTQVSIDRADLAAARQSFARFLGRWDGTPSALMVYVEDIDRYLSSH